MFQTKQWKARQGTGLNKFSIDGGVPVSLVNKPDQITVPGDAFSEENMNDLEQRIAIACVENEEKIKDLDYRLTMALVETYGVKIDKSNSNPESAVEYTNDAIGLTPSRGNDGNFIAGGWDNKYPFNKIRPCLVKDGAVVGYLNPDNYAQFEDGTVADITSGDAGDVMVEIPIFYYKISHNDTHTFVQISSIQQDGFTDKAFRYKGELTNAFYVGAYLGYVDNEQKLRSLSGVEPASGGTLSAYRTAAQMNGEGYEQLNFYKLTALQILYLIRYKSLDSQSALGQGYTGRGGISPTGETDAKGMNYGNTLATNRVKCNGIEDFFGGLYQWVDGYKIEKGYVRTADGNFSDTNNYEKYPSTLTSGVGYIKDIVGNNELAFTPQSLNGSSSTYYADQCFLAENHYLVFGGYYKSNAMAGVFFMSCNRSLSMGYAEVGARLLLCKTKKS